MSIVGLCCCSLCGEDVLDFELVILGPSEPLEPWEIEKNLWVERFSIQDVYFDVIANEPYEIPAACQNVGVEDFNDCCGGPSNNQICCPTLIGNLICPPCFESNCGCPSCENTGKTTCGGVQGNWLAPTVVTNYLNVDGDAIGVACCDCAGNFCSVNNVFNSACYADQDVIVPCLNLDEGSAILFSGSATYDTSTMYRMSRIPCDNTTAAASPAVAMGKWTFTNPPTVTSSTLLWGHGNVLYKDESVDTTCDTLIIKFTSNFYSCVEFSSERQVSATFGKRFGPPTNKYTAGSFVAGRYYKISSIGSTNFTLIGAASNTVGLVFLSTGVGTGTGTAYLARTAAELALNYTGPYKLRCVETESNEQLVAGVYYSEWNLGNHTWTGTEAPTYVAGTLGDCSCLLSSCEGYPTQGTCGTALTADYPTCVNAFTDVMSRISNLPVPPLQLVIIFT
jgi:hypothetical protein